MSERRVPAFLVHAVPGRLRLRVPARRGDAVWFTAAAECLSRHPGISGVETRPATGSLVVLHEPPTDAAAIGTHAARHGLFSLLPHADPPRQTLARHAGAGLENMDRNLCRASGGFLDLQSALMVLLLGLAVRQAVRGQVLTSSISLMWYALGLLGRPGGQKG